MIVVPFTDPPVATLGLPFDFFLLRSMNGSSHEPRFGVVALKVRAWCMEVAFATVLREGRSGVLGVILSP